MITALKKFASPQTRGTSNGNSSAKSPSSTNGTSSSGSQNENGIHAMPGWMQKKFSKGIHYNMKLLIRGDKSSGKSTLFQRLQGKQFNEKYESTDEIQVADIEWSYKATDDIIKIQIWDVVDKGKKRIKLEGLKLSDEKNQSEVNPAALDASLDAEFVDVYKGAHVAIFIFDVTKQWTFDYVKREILNCPKIPVLILGNFADQSHHRCITKDQVLGFIETLDSQYNGLVRYSESSMKNGFGLRYLHRFLGIPYLKMRREALLRQVELNEKEIDAANEELDLYAQSNECNYELFSDCITKNRRSNADRLGPTPTVDVVVGGGGQDNNGTSNNLPPRLSPQPPSSTTLNGSSSDNKLDIITSKKSTPRQSPSPNPETIVQETTSNNVNSFVPDTNHNVDSFLDDDDNEPVVSEVKKNIPIQEDYDDDDSDDDNPMVAAISEDVDFDDLETSSNIRQVDYDQI